MRKRFETEIRHSGIRRLKEALFLTGRLDVTVAEQNSVNRIAGISQQQAGEAIQFDYRRDEEAIRKFLGAVDSSWQKADQAWLVLRAAGPASR